MVSGERTINISQGIPFTTGRWGGSRVGIASARVNSGVDVGVFCMVGQGRMVGNGISLSDSSGKPPIPAMGVIRGVGGKAASAT